VARVSTARYDRIAGAYSARPDDYSGSATTALLDLVGPVAGRRVLDLACGHGTIAREMARRGASVVGLDLSTCLLAEALERETAEPLGIGYIQADAASSDTLASETFEAVVCSFGLSDIDEVHSVIGNVARLLAPSGLFVFSILHPCFPGVTRVSGSWPPNATYYDEGWWLADGELSIIRREVGANHRMVSTHLNTLIDAGLAIDRIVEPRPEEDWAYGRPGAGALPVYLVVRTRKP